MASVPIPIPDNPAWKTQVSVVWALYLRETRTRFGSYHLGLLWAVIEPAAMIILKAAIFGFILQMTIPSIPYGIFLAAGFVPFRFFTGLVSRCSSAITANQGLLVYRQVKPLDPFLARMLLEIAVFALIMTAFVLFAMWSGAAPDFGRPSLLMISFASLLMISMGLGIFLGVLAHSHRELQKIVPMVIQPLLFVSCVLFPLSRVPSNVQHFFIWNPLVVIFEGFRKGLYSHYPTPELPVLYPFAFGIVCLWVGVSYYWRKIDLLYLPTNG